MTIRLGGPLAGLARRFGLTIALEDGSTRSVAIGADDGRRGEATAADGRKAAFRDVTLPSLPLGRHRICADEAPECTAHLAIVPGCGVFAGNPAGRGAQFWDRRTALCTAA